MYKAITDRIKQDADYPARQHQIYLRELVLEGKIYDALPHAFNEERQTGTGEYIPFKDRRPSVRTGICRVVVDDSISLLFSEGHFPEVESTDQVLVDTLSAFIKEAKMNDLMFDAATRGSVGSVCIWMRVLKSRVFLKAMSTQFLTPIWDPNAPDTLAMVREKYKISGQQVRDMGYSVVDDDLRAEFWFQREWDDREERWFTPWKVRQDPASPNAGPKVDVGRTKAHQLGFVPMYWTKNLPGGDDTDGVCTFPDDAVSTMIEGDYLLSQGGRGLKYAADPTLVIMDKGVGNDARAGGASTALALSSDGDAKLLEINGTSSAAILDYVQGLRAIAIERMHGNRTNPDKLAAAQSGRAMEMMNQALIWLADRLRITYGEGALLALLRMFIRASNVYPLEVAGQKVAKLPQDAPVTLRWPDWYPRTADDRNTTAQALKHHQEAGHMSRETAVKAIAADYDIVDVPAELSRIETERQQMMEQELALKAAGLTTKDSQN